MKSGHISGLPRGIPYRVQIKSSEPRLRYTHARAALSNEKEKNNSGS